MNTKPDTQNEEQAETESVTVQLTKAIRAHGQDVTELILRPQTVDDMCEIGQPFLIIVGEGDTGVRIQSKTVAQYISRLAGVPRSSVSAMSPKDFSAASAVVLGFFGASEDGTAVS